MISFNPLAFLFLCGVVFALFLTALGAALKLLGVLVLSWWWICLPAPALILVGLAIVGLCSHFD